MHFCIFSRLEKVPGLVPLFTDLWSYFACDGQIEIVHRCKYLMKCFSVENFLSVMNNDEQQLHTSVKKQRKLSDYAVSGWINCSIQLSLSTCTSLPLLTKYDVLS